jgi:hypothetical protein
MLTSRFNCCFQALVIGPRIVTGGVTCASERVMSSLCGRELGCQRCTGMPSKCARRMNTLLMGDASILSISWDGRDLDLGRIFPLGVAWNWTPVKWGLSRPISINLATEHKLHHHIARFGKDLDEPSTFSNPLHCMWSQRLWCQGRRCRWDVGALADSSWGKDGRLPPFLHALTTSLNLFLSAHVADVKHS